MSSTPANTIHNLVGAWQQARNRGDHYAMDSIVKNIAKELDVTTGAVEEILHRPSALSSAHAESEKSPVLPAKNKADEILKRICPDYKPEPEPATLAERILKRIGER